MSEKTNLKHQLRKSTNTKPRERLEPETLKHETSRLNIKRLQ